LSGQIIKRGKRKFLVRIFLGRDAKGKRRYHNKTIQGSKKDAEKYRNKILREVDLGNFVEPSKVILRDHLENWLDNNVKNNNQESTYKNYKQTLKNYIYPAIGDFKLSDITAQEIQRNYNFLSKRLSSATIRNAHAVLRKGLEDAVKMGLIPNNPAKRVSAPRAEKKEIMVLSGEELGRFLLEAREDKFFGLFLILATTGLRPSEGRALKWDDFDLAKKTVSIRRSIDKDNSKGEFKELKTKKSYRKIILFPGVVRVLKEKKQNEKINTLNLVFPNEQGKPIQHRNLVRRHFKPILNKAEIDKKFNLYGLRHTFATLMLSEGIHPKIVSEMLGHESTSTTLDLYSHVLPDMQEQVVGRWENILKKERWI